MFDLNSEITGWCNKLAESRTLNTDDVEEIQAHLNDQVEQLSATGLTDEEAFIVTKHRLGSPALLTAEFAKVNPSRQWSYRFFWMIAGIMGFAAINNLASLVVTAFSFFGTLAGFQARTLGFAGITAKTMILLAVLIVVLRYCSPTRSSKHDSRIKTPTRMTIVLLFALMIILFVARMFAPALAARVMSASEYGQVHLIFSYYSLAYAVIVYPIMAGLLFWLRKRSTGLAA